MTDVTSVLIQSSSCPTTGPCMSLSDVPIATAMYDTVPSNNVTPNTYSVTELSNITSNVTSLPEEMTFGSQHVISIATYSCLFVIAATGNLTVFITLFRNRNAKSRVNMFIMHLAIADLIVTFIMMPLEIAWSITVEWRAGDVGCRLLMFFRTFGLYLSSFILVVISLDRYFAILHPLSLNDADKRGKIMLVFAWLFSVAASIPQCVIFHEERHPDYPWFRQCVTFNFFPTPNHELVYNLFHMVAMYGLPLVIITLSYTLILREISKKTKQSKEEMLDMKTDKRRHRLRRSAVGNIGKARSRTLKMTVVIVSVFVLCWTPYFVIAVWWWFDRDSAKKLDLRIQKGLFMFAVSNSCVNPIVYGLFTINFKREFVRCCCCFKSKWGQRKLKVLSENYFTRSNPNIGQSRTSHTSLRTYDTHGGTMHFIVDKNSRMMSSVRYSVRKPEEPQTSNGNKSILRESQCNKNNFMSVHLSDTDTSQSNCL